MSLDNYFIMSSQLDMTHVTIFVRHMTLEQWTGHVTKIICYKMAANSPNFNV